MSDNYPNYLETPYKELKDYLTIAQYEVIQAITSAYSCSDDPIIRIFLVTGSFDACIQLIEKSKQ